MADAAQEYRAARDRVIGLVTEENEGETVPACPEWTLHDMVSHERFLVDDALNGNMQGAPGDAWTAAQVARGKDLSLEELTQQWREATSERNTAFDTVAKTALPDILIHELDIRGAVGNTGGRDNPGLAGVFTMMSGAVSDVFKQQGLPALQVVADDQEAVLGEGEPRGTLTTSVFEATRVLSGRRSRKQIEAMDWSTDPAPWLDHLSVLGHRDDDLVE